MVKLSNHIYLIDAERKTSQFGQTNQVVRCRVLEAHRGYVLVESLRRYNKKYEGANKTAKGQYKGMPVRRINKDQISSIVDERTGKAVAFNTLRRREGSSKNPGRARGGK